MEYCDRICNYEGYWCNSQQILENLYKKDSNKSRCKEKGDIKQSGHCQTAEKKVSRKYNRKGTYTLKENDDKYF